MEENNNSLGCGKKIRNFNHKQIESINNFDFICGVPNGWGEERLCKDCMKKVRES